MRITRLLVLLFLTLLCASLSGCFLVDTPEPELTAVIAPEQSIVPYTAKIVATAPAGTFTFELPHTTVEQSDGVLEVFVDTITWSATVLWTDGKIVKSTTVTAHGSNPRPTIHRPRINGIASTWYLEPREKTLLDFSYHAASMTSPRSGVSYDGHWSIREISVECSEKQLCGQPVPDSIYYPPYEEGVYHASFNNHIYESACIVYPTSTYESASTGLPYCPHPLAGYNYDAFQNRSLFRRVEFPAQTATIRVVVQDNFARLTEATFEIPVGPVLSDTSHEQATPFEDALYFVASKDKATFHRSWCYGIYQIPAASRVYFAEYRHAEESGRTLDPDCAGE